MAKSRSRLPGTDAPIPALGDYVVDTRTGERGHIVQVEKDWWFMVQSATHFFTAPARNLTILLKGETIA